MADAFKKQTQLIGILNITPDSFSDGGRFLNPLEALLQAFRLEKDGSDWIELGAESTRPGAKPVEASEQIDRLGPIFEVIKNPNAFLDQKNVDLADSTNLKLHLPIAVDTRSAKVAKFAFEQGATLLNDVSGFEQDPDMIDFLVQKEAAAVLMHHLGTPETMRTLANGFKGISELVDFFEKRLETLEKQGIKREKLIVDPGIGFGKLPEHNIEIFANLDRLNEFGLPTLIGLSRKSFLDHYFGKTSHASERGLETEIVHALLIATNPPDFLRVHAPGPIRKTLSIFEKWKEKRQARF